MSALYSGSQRGRSRNMFPIFKNVSLLCYTILFLNNLLNNKCNYFMYLSINHNVANDICIQYAGHQCTLVNQSNNNNVCVLKIN